MRGPGAAATEVVPRWLTAPDSWRQARKASSSDVVVRQKTCA